MKRLRSPEELLADPNWLCDYPQEVRQGVAWQMRRQRASKRMAPLSNGKRDPWNPYPSEGPEAA